ncbi:MAG TPA: hypothetical protein VI136_15100 [Verrucomicrobiae bacterium]
MKITTTLLGLALVGLANFTQSHAATLYVDQRYGPGGNGSTNAPYNTIQAAINDGRSTDVIVYPGTYMENLSILKSIRIIGYDGPHTTAIDGSAGSNTVSVAQGLTVWLMGLKISSGVTGVYQPTQGALYLRNCIVCGNRSHGVYVECTSTTASPILYMDNCISVANGGSGLHIHGECTGIAGNRIPTARAHNNILIGNTGFGLELYVKSYNSGYGFSLGEITVDYNDYAANVAGNYSSLFGPAGRISVGANSFSGTPDFVGGSANTCNQDYRLAPGSPCRNAGSPGLGWVNPDGTRCDIGAYGGPGAATFFTNPNDGPIIRNVTIDQGMVPKGSTFTIRATGAVR